MRVSCQGVPLWHVIWSRPGDILDACFASREFAFGPVEPGWIYVVLSLFETRRIYFAHILQGAWVAIMTKSPFPLKKNFHGQKISLLKVENFKIFFRQKICVGQSNFTIFFLLRIFRVEIVLLKGLCSGLRTMQTQTTARFSRILPLVKRERELACESLQIIKCVSSKFESQSWWVDESMRVGAQTRVHNLKTLIVVYRVVI